MANVYYVEIFHARVTTMCLLAVYTRWRVSTSHNKDEDNLPRLARLQVSDIERGEQGKSTQKCLFRG